MFLFVVCVISIFLIYVKLHLTRPRLPQPQTQTNMADRILLNATKGKPKSIHLFNKNLERVPAIIGTITSLRTVDLKNNRIKGLPKEFAALYQVGENIDLSKL